MKRMLVLVGALLIATGALAQERPATKAEIQKIAVGKTVNGRMAYGKDGSYTYDNRDKGRYTISAGKICVKFTNGFQRCDRIVTDGKKFTLINQKGDRFPYGS